MNGKIKRHRYWVIDAGTKDVLSRHKNKDRGPQNAAQWCKAFREQGFDARVVPARAEAAQS